MKHVKIAAGVMNFIDAFGNAGLCNTGQVIRYLMHGRKSP